MNWKMKSAVQRTLAHVPVGKQALYRQFQCHCGKLVKGYDYSFLLSETAKLAQLLAANGFSIEGSSVLEVGTGWRLDIPIAFYLCGARRAITCDLNRYLEPGLALKTVEYVLANRDAVQTIFNFVEPSLLRGRIDRLAEISNIEQLFSTTGIEYRAPFDCAKTGLPDGSIDLHFSYTVFEHVPEPILEAILLEANRILSDRGVALHHIDLSDHFEQVDKSITKINFLRFSEAEWRRYSDTPWSYHNRLREDEFRKIFKRTQKLVHWKGEVDQDSVAALQNGFPLAPRYRDKAAEVLGTVLVDVISQPTAKVTKGKTQRALVNVN